MTDRATVLALLRAGLTQGQVALRLGVTKNVVAGIWRDHGDPVTSTLYTRCDALDAALKAVLRDTRGVGRVPNVPKLRVVR